MHTRVEISRSAMLHNVSVFRELAPESLFMAVVKSNAYGHGLNQSVQILRGSVDWYGVNTIWEARTIRKHDPDTPILIMGAIDFSEGLEDIPDGTHITISNIEEIKILERDYPEIPFHLKVDTGMSRLGLHGAKLDHALQYLEDRGDLAWAGLMTHFANVEDVSDQGYSLKQLHRFQDACARARSAAGVRKLICHSAASAAAMILPEAQMDMIRVGISLYGLWPSDTTRVSLLGLRGSLPELRPAMQWITRIVHINEVEAGVSVGYGCTYRTQTPTRIAVLPVGYYEGYSRGYSNRSHVVIGGLRARIIGRVCMNMIMVDVTHIPGVKKGDEAVLIGSLGEESVSAEELAGLISTINYEVTTMIEEYIPRVIVE
jgi:alanine racemase